MVRTYSYAILQAVPDIVRNERVNIGIVVLRGDGLDIEVLETRKIQALTGTSWDSLINSFTTLLESIDMPDKADTERLEIFRVIEGGIVLADQGWFTADTLEEYKRRVQEIVRRIVRRPFYRPTKDDPSIVSKISAVLRSDKILAKRDDDLNTGKVLRAFEIEAGLSADFVQLNGIMYQTHQGPKRPPEPGR